MAILLTIGEVLKKVNDAPDKAARKEILYKYDGPHIREFFNWAFNDIPYVYKNRPLPDFKLNDPSPVGLGLTHLGKEIKKFKYLIDGADKQFNLSTDKQDEIAILIHDALDINEQPIFRNLLQGKRIECKGLTKKFLKEVYQIEPSKA